MKKIFATKHVGKYSLEGVLVKRYSSIKEAALEGYNSPSIFECCNGRRKNHKDFVWRWEEDLLENEVWLKHPILDVGISNLGRVQTKRAGRTYGCIVDAGYCKVSVKVETKYKQFLVHRLVLETFQPISDKLTVDHIDGNRSNNKLENLRWATSKEQALNRRTLKRKHCQTCNCE